LRFDIVDAMLLLLLGLVLGLMMSGCAAQGLPIEAADASLDALPCGHLGEPCCGFEYRFAVPRVPYCTDGLDCLPSDGENTPAVCK
jgi:hypothetical protein